MGSVQFQRAPCPAYTSRYLQAPSGVVGVTYRDFNLLHRALLERFPLFTGFCLQASSVSDFALTQRAEVVSCPGRWFILPRGGRALQADAAGGGSARSAPAALGLPRSRACARPVYAAQAPGCSTWSGPCAACGSSFRVLHKSADSVGPAFCKAGVFKDESRYLQA